MAINRFMQPAQQSISQRWLSPNFQLLAGAMGAAQQEQDQATGMLNKLRETQFQHLVSDTEKAEGIYNDIFTTVDNLSTGMAGNGDLRSSRFEIEQYERDLLRRFRPQGDIGKMVSNYNTYAKYAEQLDKMHAEGHLTGGAVERLKAKTLEQYEQQGGIGAKDENGRYQNLSTITPAQYFDVGEYLEDAGDGFFADSRENVQVGEDGKPVIGAMWRDAGKIWKKTTFGIREVKFQEVFNHMLSGVANNPKAVEYINQTEMLGLSKASFKNLFKDDGTGDLSPNMENPLMAQIVNAAKKYSGKEMWADEDMKFDSFDVAKMKMDYESRVAAHLFNSSSTYKAEDGDELRDENKNLELSLKNIESRVGGLQKLVESGKATQADKAELSQKVQELQRTKMKIQINKNALRHAARTAGVYEDKSYKNALKKVSGMVSNQSLLEELIRDVASGASGSDILFKRFKEFAKSGISSDQFFSKLGFKKNEIAYDEEELRIMSARERAKYIEEDPLTFANSLNPEWLDNAQEKTANANINYVENDEIVVFTSGEFKKAQDELADGLANGSIGFSMLNSKETKNLKYIQSMLRNKKSKPRFELIANDKYSVDAGALKMIFTDNSGEVQTHTIFLDDSKAGRRLYMAAANEAKRVQNNPDFAKTDINGRPVKVNGKFVLTEEGEAVKDFAFYADAATFTTKLPDGTPMMTFTDMLAAEHVEQLPRNGTAVIPMTTARQIKLTGMGGGQFIAEYVTPDGSSQGYVGGADSYTIYDYKGLVTQVGKDIARAREMKRR